MKFGPVAVGAVLMVTGPIWAEAQAADARLLRVGLLRSADRVSLAVEMTAEPKKATLRVVSDSVLELEVGPVIGPVREEQLAPAAVVPVVKEISVRRFRTGNRAHLVRARVTLHGSGRGDVRVVGRVVYIDFAAPAPASPLPTFQQISVSAREPHLATVARGALSEVVGQTSAAARSARDEPAQPRAEPRVARGVEGPVSGYRDAVRPLVARVTEIGPFLLSAAAAPSGEVLATLGRTLMDVERPLRAIVVPQASRPAHNLLISAVAEARRAVAPEFRGNRDAQARHALALLDAARNRMP